MATIKVKSAYEAAKLEAKAAGVQLVNEFGTTLPIGKFRVRMLDAPSMRTFGKSGFGGFGCNVEIIGDFKESNNDKHIGKTGFAVISSTLANKLEQCEDTQEFVLQVVQLENKKETISCTLVAVHTQTIEQPQAQS